MANEQQYPEKVAQSWDRLINWGRRREACGDFFPRHLPAGGDRRVLDMSTGTGFDTVMLLRRGFKVTSLDGSPSMLKVARENAERHGVSSQFVPVCGRWQDVARLFTAKFDAIICLGNSICHLSAEERPGVLSQVYSLLPRGGIFIVDYRNYDKLLKGEATGHGSYYLGDVDIRIKVEGGQVKPDYVLGQGASFSLSFNPIPIRVALRELRGAGFKVRVYSDLKLGYCPNAAFYQAIASAG